jgi:hypothetical protein
MIRIFVFVAALIMSTVANADPLDEAEYFLEPEVQPVCRHTAIACGLAASERYPVRIARGRLTLAKHAQAQAMVNGKWYFLRRMGRYCVFTPKSDRFRVDEYTTLKEYMEEIRQFAERKRSQLEAH